MWKNYSADYIKNNRASGLSVKVASFIAALFLTFLCFLFYHFWLDNIEGSGQPGGDWQGALPVYAAIVAVMCLSLILVIHNAFGVSMNSRIHQFGIFASIGATPKQIRTCLLQEAFALSMVPVFWGMFAGVLLSCGTIRLMSAFAETIAGGRWIAFRLNPAVLAAVFLLILFTILISAWIPAGKLSRMTPLTAIRGGEEWQPAKRERKRARQAHSPVLYALFGMEGELAGNALKAQKKAMRTTSLSLAFAFFGFMVSQCFWTISSISTNHTYFETYQDAWDVMVTVKDTDIGEFALTEKVKETAGAESVIVYQKAQAVCMLPGGLQSRALQALGGLQVFSDAEGIRPSDEGVFQIKAPIMILDDGSFEAFCGQTGIRARKDGVIVLNRFWDSVNSNFRYPVYIPYVDEGMETVTLQKAVGEQGAFQAVTEIPVLACTKTPPLLREEYEKGDYPLVLFMPVSLWGQVRDKAGAAFPDTYIRVLAKEREEAAALNGLEDEVMETVSREYKAESENRIQEKRDNDEMIRGYQLILGAFCVLLAIIGIAHMFSHTLGFLRQRKREFARYMSVGLTPAGVWKIFGIEAFVTVGRPLFFTLLMTVIATAYMIRASYLDPMEFIREAPVLPVFLFALGVLISAASAYYLGGKKSMDISLADALRDDTML